MVIGLSLTLFLMLTGRDPYLGMNAGFIALCLNLAVTVTVSLLTRARVAGFDETFSSLEPSPAARPARIA